MFFRAVVRFVIAVHSSPSPVGKIFCVPFRYFSDSRTFQRERSSVSISSPVLRDDDARSRVCSFSEGSNHPPFSILSYLLSIFLSVFRFASWSSIKIIKNRVRISFPFVILSFPFISVLVCFPRREYVVLSRLFLFVRVVLLIYFVRMRERELLRTFRERK